MLASLLKLGRLGKSRGTISCVEVVTAEVRLLVAGAMGRNGSFTRLGAEEADDGDDEALEDGTEPDTDNSEDLKGGKTQNRTDFVDTFAC